MINTTYVDALERPHKHLDADGNDMVREMVTAFAQELICAEPTRSAGRATAR